MSWTTAEAWNRAGILVKYFKPWSVYWPFTRGNKKVDHYRNLPMLLLFIRFIYKIYIILFLLVLKAGKWISLYCFLIVFIFFFQHSFAPVIRSRPCKQNYHHINGAMKFLLNRIEWIRVVSWVFGSKYINGCTIMRLRFYWGIFIRLFDCVQISSTFM